MPGVFHHSSDAGDYCGHRHGGAPGGIHGHGSGQEDTGVHGQCVGEAGPPGEGLSGTGGAD